MIAPGPLSTGICSKDYSRSTTTDTVVMEVYVFGDQTADCRSFLTKVFARKEDVLLHTFLEKASEAIRAEHHSRSHISNNVPSFGTVQELIDRYSASDVPDPAIESAIVCLSHFAHFIG